MGRMGMGCGAAGGQKELCLQLRKALPEGGTELPQGQEEMSPECGDITGFGGSLIGGQTLIGLLSRVLPPISCPLAVRKSSPRPEKLSNPERSGKGRNRMSLIGILCIKKLFRAAVTLTPPSQSSDLFGYLHPPLPAPQEEVPE